MHRLIIVLALAAVAGCASQPPVKYRSAEGKEVWCGSAMGGLIGMASRDTCIKSAEEQGWKRIE
jgi:hypothetical protein